MMNAMSTAILVPVEEYLATSYPDGDREYLEGQLLEKNMGEVDHSDLQSTILVFFRRNCPGFGRESRFASRSRPGDSACPTFA